MTRFIIPALALWVATPANATTTDYAPFKATDGEIISFQGDRIVGSELGVCVEGSTLGGTYWDPHAGWAGLPPESHFGEGPAPSHGLLEEVTKWIKEAGTGYKNCAGQARLAFETCVVAADDDVEIECCDMVRENWEQMCWEGEVAVDDIPIDHFMNLCVIDDEGPDDGEPDQPEVEGATSCSWSTTLNEAAVVFFDADQGGMLACDYSGEQRIVTGKDGQHCAIEYDESGMFNCQLFETEHGVCHQ